VHSLEKFLAPESIAIIGASRREGSLGKMFLDAVVKMSFAGKIYPVNPKADRIADLPCYADILSLPEVPDLAVILLPKEFVLPAVQDLIQKGVHNVIVISAGFREVGGAGIELENKLLQLIKSNRMRMIGPNCMGIFNTHPQVRLNATFSPTQPCPGHIGFISQSGALGVAVLELAKTTQLGFSIFVSTGNKADITDFDVLEYLGSDANTRVIALYQESIDHPDEFRKICAEIVPHKPVLTLKAGRTGSGLRAASSHTGALAADDLLTSAFLKQCGLLRCDSLQELTDTALAFSRQATPAGNRVAVITNSGGPAILASDTIEGCGLQLPSLNRDTIEQLKQVLPAEAACSNPVDMIASAIHDTYKKVYSLVEKDPNIDAVIVIIVKPPTGTTPEKIIEELSALSRSSAKPFFVVLMAAAEDQLAYKLCQQFSMPVFNYPETAAAVLGKMWKYHQIKMNFTDKKPAGNQQRKQIDTNKKTVQASFTAIAARLVKYQLPLVPHLLTFDKTACIDFNKKHGPLVLKIANPEIIHKSDTGLVFLNLSGAASISRAYDQLINSATGLLPAGTEPQVLVQQMIPAGLELVLGYKYDPLYGNVIMFGIGGVLIDLYKDVAFRILPLDVQEIRSMIAEIKGFPLLTGYRRGPVFNLDKLVQIIQRFAELVSENKDITEMDLNPLIWPVDAPSPVIVDSRMTVQN
jgi:acetyl coenzyme A synthetase (ADP forming)-like protein